MLITYNGLVDLVDFGVMTVSGGIQPEHIGAASIDVHLGRWIYTENPRGGVVDLAAKEAPNQIKLDLSHAPYELRPGEFIIAQTRELFNLPNHVAALFLLRSSMARAGLEHSEAGWADPGWSGSVLTLELRNNCKHHALLISEGLRVGQMVFWSGEEVPEHASYAVRGRYNGDREAQPSKGA